MTYTNSNHCYSAIIGMHKFIAPSLKILWQQKFTEELERKV